MVKSMRNENAEKAGGSGEMFMRGRQSEIDGERGRGGVEDRSEELRRDFAPPPGGRPSQRR